MTKEEEKAAVSDIAKSLAPVSNALYTSALALARASGFVDAEFAGAHAMCVAYAMIRAQIMTGPADRAAAFRELEARSMAVTSDHVERENADMPTKMTGSA